jgi:diacylglycerol kinase family enzyme
LARAAQILQARVYGLGLGSKEEFLACARDLAAKCDVLVVAGGDGTLSDVINAVGTKGKPVAYLPLGSGNAMAHALRLHGSIEEAALRIKEGRIRQIDLIQCDERRLAYMVSLGLESAVIQKRNKYKAQGVSGFKGYLMAVAAACLKDVKGIKARIVIDGRSYQKSSLLTIMIMKQPYYGYGLKVMPGARLDDGKLHVRVLRTGMMPSLAGGMASLTIGNRMGFYRAAERVCVTLEKPLIMQADGDLAWGAKEFHFKVLPRGLRLKA